MFENIIIITKSIPLIDSFKLHLSKYKPKYSIAKNLSDGSNFLDTEDQIGVFIDIDGITGDYSEILNKNKFTVALGRNNNDDYKQGYLDKGFSLYIQKPINKQVLENIFEDYTNFYSSVKTKSVDNIDAENNFMNNDNIVVEDIIIDDDDFYSSDISFKKDVKINNLKDNSRYDDFVIDIEEEVVLNKEVVRTIVPELIYNKKREVEEIDIDIDTSEDDLSEDINGSTLNKEVEYIKPQEVISKAEKPLPNIRLNTKNNDKNESLLKKDTPIITTKATVNKEQLMLEKMREQLFKKTFNTVVEKKKEVSEVKTKEEPRQSSETMEERIAKIKSLINERNKRKDRNISKEELEDKIGVGYKEEDDFIIINENAPNYKHKQSFVRYRKDKALFEYRLRKLKEKRMSIEEITKKMQEIEHEEIKIREKTISAREQRRREMYDKLGFSNNDIFSRKTEKIQIKAPTNVNKKIKPDLISSIQTEKIDHPKKNKESVEVSNKHEIRDLKSIESNVEIINNIEKENYERKPIPKVSTEDINKLLEEKKEVSEVKEKIIEEIDDIDIQDDIKVIDDNDTKQVEVEVEVEAEAEVKVDILETLRQKKSTIDKQEIIYNDIHNDKTQKSNILKSHADNKDSKRVLSIKDMEERLPKIDLLSLYKPSKSNNNEEKVSSLKKEIEIKPPRHIIEAEEEKFREEELRNTKKKKGLFGLFGSMKK